jgi:hypothetical protein
MSNFKWIVGGVQHSKELAPWEALSLGLDYNVCKTVTGSAFISVALIESTCAQLDFLKVFAKSLLIVCSTFHRRIFSRGIGFEYWP